MSKWDKSMYWMKEGDYPSVVGMGIGSRLFNLASSTNFILIP